MNKANTSDKETSFLDLNLKIIGNDMDTSNTTKAITLILISYQFLVDSYVIYISQLFRFARVTRGLDFNSKSSNYFKTNDTGLHILQTSKNIWNVF